MWADLDLLLSRSFPHAGGSELHILSAAIDSGGHHTQAVYDFCRKRSPRTIAIKGQSQAGKPVVGRPSLVDVTWNGLKIPGALQLWPVGSDTAKGVLYSRLKIASPGPGCYHWPIGLDDDYFLQITAEKLVTKYVKGFPRLEWTLTGPRNEALDCEIYSYVAAIRAGIHHMDMDKLEKSYIAGPQALPAASKSSISARPRTGWFGRNHTTGG